MTTQLLASELANLVQESKRKNNDLRQAAEKSLEELKALSNNSEQSAPEELSQKPNFVNPFIIACGTKNAKFTGIAIVCLQRLIVARALPRAKLNQVLEALMQASSAGLDVQLKILQALPSLVQNYASDLKGDLLVTALNICFILQSSKNAIVNNTSAATLQQLVVSVFDKVVAEDKNATDAPFVGEAPTSEGTVNLRAAALDAHRVFNDLCLMTENQRPEFLRFSGLSQTFGLELIESVITNHTAIFTTHPEQAQVLRVRVLPLIMSALRGKPSFATTVRLVRILYTVLRRHINVLPTECGEALEVLTRLLDQDAAIWKRALCMEVFRGIFGEHALLRRIYALYDAQEGERDILKPLTATFVRISTEKPAVIGLSHQSTLPVSTTKTTPSGQSDQAMLEASGVTGMISSAVGSEVSSVGVSTQWSSVRVPCIDQLDKTDPPAIPESYIYSLILASISSLSDGLAKFILPLTVNDRSRRKVSKNGTGRDSPSEAHVDAGTPPPKGGLERSPSVKRNPGPVNPLALEDHPMLPEVKICSALVDECWPAILATCSTFLYAALDSDYYHGLVRAFQRFAHVAGLLQLSTPRDAFLTTLGKAAVPPNILTANLNLGQPRPSTPGSAVETPTTLLSNARGLLSVDNLTAASPSAEKQRQGVLDQVSASLNTRNLLCLRALLNLGIALGPTLSSAWRIVLETLQQADFVLFSSGKTPGRTPSFSRGQDQPGEAEGPSLMANFGTEVRAVETAASRLMESTVDFPNESFVEVIKAVCNLLERRHAEPPQPDSGSRTPSIAGPTRGASPGNRRSPSFSYQPQAGAPQQDQFALAKLGDIAMINIERLLTYPADESGWNSVIYELNQILDTTTVNPSVRTRAAETLVKLALEAANVVVSMPGESQGEVQTRILTALRDALVPFRDQGRQATVADRAVDIDLHKIILDGLRNIMDDCGESLVSGWDIAFEIIGSIFIIRDEQAEERRGSSLNPILLDTRSSKLVRSAFNSLQLICSDFLSSLPNSCFLILVDTLYKFCSQDDDLNIALTNVTFFWTLSDFFSRKNESLDITADLMQGTDISELERMAADRSHERSDAALWMLLLLRLTMVASDDRLELRNSAVQTLLRIFDAYGDRLNAEAWSICVKSVIFKLMGSLKGELEAAMQDDSDDNHSTDWNDTAVLILDGISNLLANYLQVLVQHPSFNHLWKELLEYLASLLDFQVLDINTATYKALGHVLSQSNDGDQDAFNEATVTFAWDLWARGIPKFKSTSGKSEDNQACLLAYVAALQEIYKLIQADLTVERIQKILELLQEAVEAATIGSYTLDVEQMTPLQAQTLQAVRMIRTDLAGSPSAVISQISRYISLAYDQDHSPKSGLKRTYVAMSKASMQAAGSLVLEHASEKDVYESGALAAVLSALNRPISLKYRFSIVTRSTQPWQLATSTAQSILEATLPNMGRLGVSQSAGQGVWAVVADIADAILSADCDKATPGNDIAQDEQFDIDAFHKLRDLITPSVGAEAVPDKTRKAYADSLFRTSIIHEPAPVEKSIIDGGHEAGLSALYTPRPGRTATVAPTKRPKMSYVAFGELFSLVAAKEGPSATPTTKSSAQDKEKLALEARIGRVAAPFIILRCALSLRAFVADQPLRGQMPQPLSQKKELIWILRKLVDLKSQSGAIPALEGVESENRKHLLRLYPLLVKGLGVTGDDKVMELLRDALETVGDDFGI